LAFSRNFGAFAATSAGLAHARGELFGVMAADLQEPPELILNFREHLLADEYDIVVGTRAARSDPLGQRMASAIFWGLYRFLVQREIRTAASTCSPANRIVRDHLCGCTSRTLRSSACYFGSGFGAGRWRTRAAAAMAAVHGPSGDACYLLDSTFAFRTARAPAELGGVRRYDALRRLGFCCCVAKLLGTTSVPGYTATVLVVIFFGGLNSLGLGILGEYVWRAFENTKGRPAYLVVSRQTFGPTDGER
jgi:hypothetical protein